jgi:hypothetical protein
VGVAALAIVAQDACILAQPSGDLPRLPESRPNIVHSSLVPATSAVLTRFPSTLIVPVELNDPTVGLVYAAFVDYNPLTGNGLVGEIGHSQPEPNTVGRTRTLTINLPMTLEPDRCHVIEVVVALRLASELDFKLAHTPAEPGGDFASWLYNPNGDLLGCPSLDAGIDAPTGDGEAGEGGTQ